VDAQMSEELEALKKAREELRKQFISRAVSLAQGFKRPKTSEDIEEILKLRNAIDALDHAIDNSWAAPR
jgi:hypothetical protein